MMTEQWSMSLTNRHTRCQALILDKKKTRVLLVQHQNTYGTRYWWLPGGGLEPGEEAELCIRRELREELDIEVDIIDTFMLGNILQRNYRMYITFICTYSGDIECMRYEDNTQWKILQAKWFSFHDEKNWKGIFRDDDIHPFLCELRWRLHVAEKPIDPPTCEVRNT